MFAADRPQEAAETMGRASQPISGGTSVPILRTMHPPHRKHYRTFRGVTYDCRGNLLVMGCDPDQSKEPGTLGNLGVNLVNPNFQDVLVVDDDENMLEILSHILVSAGFRVRTAAGGAEALQSRAAAVSVFCDY